MDSTPPLTRSPASPPNSYSPSAGFPSPDLVSQHYRLSVLEPRCSMAPPLDSDSSLPPLEGMGQPGWGHGGMLHQAPSAAPAMPSIVSSEYDGFVAYDAGPMAGSHPYGHHDVYNSHHHHHHHHHQQQQQQHHLEPAMSAHSSPRTHSRSPVAPLTRSMTSSYAPPPGAPLSQPLTPRIKMEAAQPEYVQGADYPSPRSIHVPYSTDVSSYSAAAPSSGYLSDTQSSAWSKDYHSAEPESFYSVGSSQPLGLVGERRAHMRAHRPRARKRLTTKEEANFQCEVKGCGKLFSRSYNFKAHMETHDQNREYPFPCGECSKKFVRKTDLQRHHQSVHMKERNHKCDFCGRLFARKDTLRRHMEDGCSRRFDITLPPMSIPSMGSSSMLDPAATLRSRDGIPSNDHHNPDEAGAARLRHGWGLA